MYQYERGINEETPGIGHVLRTHDLPPFGKDHPYGTHGWQWYWHARDSSGKGHLHGEPIYRHRTYLLLAQTL